MNGQITEEEKFIHRCIALARCASGHTYPNPMVGCVIVNNGKIIGEGYHRKAGEGHAEVNAIASVKDAKLLQSSTLYVSLEPCAHFGKTPPCAKLIIEKQIPKVVVGCVDSFSAVSGKGIEMLRAAGVEVIVGVCERECRELNKRFFTFYEKHRPYIILKWAESADGFIGKRGEAIWLTNDQCRRLVHKQRAENEAIIIGVETANNDDPSLTTRAYFGENALRVVIDPHRRLLSTSKLLNDGGKTLVINEFDSTEDIIKQLYERGIQSAIVEGGAKTLNTFIMSNLWDEAYIYKSPKIISGDVCAPKINGEVISEEDIDGVRLKVLKREL